MALYPRHAAVCRPERVEANPKVLETLTEHDALLHQRGAQAQLPALLAA